MAYAVIAALASIFYYIGNHEYYDKGWVLAIASIVLSLLACLFLPFGFFGAIGINLLLYVGLIVYNIISKRPPGSRSGF